jgi:HEAT repeat protein
MDTRFFFRAEAVKALANIGPPALPELIAALQRGDSPELQLGAMLALQRMAQSKQGVAEAVPGLVLLLKESVPLAHSAACTLEAIGPGSKAAVPDLLVMLRTATRSLRIKAAQALGRIDQEAAFPGLREGLKDEDRFVRMNIVLVLGHYQNARLALPALAQALQDKDVDVRTTAAHSLWRFRSEEAARILTSGLQDPERKVRQHAAAYLAEFGPLAKDAVPGLLQAVKDNDRFVRQQAANALKRIDPEAAAKAGVR